MIFRIPLEKQILWHNFGIQKFLFKCHNSCQQTSVHLGCMRAPTRAFCAVECENEVRSHPYSSAFVSAVALASIRGVWSSSEADVGMEEHLWVIDDDNGKNQRSLQTAEFDTWKDHSRQPQTHVAPQTRRAVGADDAEDKIMEEIWSRRGHPVYIKKTCQKEVTGTFFITPKIEV